MSVVTFAFYPLFFFFVLFFRSFLVNIVAKVFKKRMSFVGYEDGYAFAREREWMVSFICHFVLEIL